MYNFTVSFDRNSKKPLYEQLYNYIVNEIRSKNLSPDERMPSKKSLASHLGISRNTIETAYEILVDEGYLRSVPRSGYYVCRIDEPVGEKIEVTYIKPIKKSDYRIDFRTNAVDSHAFPFATWAKLSKEVSSPQLLDIGNSQGDYDLREVIAKYLHEFRGVRCAPEQIVVGAGMEYLLMLLMKILGDKKTYAFENPGYGKSHNIIAAGGSDIIYIPLDEDGMKTEVLKKSKADIVYITPSHQFPTGAVMNVGRRLELLSWASENDCYIIEDDYNSEFNFSVKPVPAVQGLVDGARVIYMSTFSRILAPSIRIAYMVLPPKLLDNYKKSCGMYSPTVSRFEQQTLKEFISGGYLQRHLNRIKNIYRKRRDMMISALNTLPYPLEIYGEKSGLHLLVKTPMAKEILKKSAQKGIKLYDLDDYYFTPQKESSNTLIIGYASCTEEDIDELIKANT